MSTMFVVSCRKDFWSATEFSTTDEIRDLDLDTGHGPVITPVTFLEALAHKRLTVLVHGYNNERLDILAAYRTIDAHMRLLGLLGAGSPPYDALVGFAWPAGRPVCHFPSPVAEPMIPHRARRTVCHGGEAQQAGYRKAKHCR